MKTFTIPTVLLAIVCLISGFSTQIHACGRSNVGLDSVVYTANSSYTIYLKLCIGGGPSTLATQDTRDIGFAFYRNGDPGFRISAFTPDTIVGDTTGIVQYGYDVGPRPAAPFYSHGTIGYSPIPGNSLAYICVSSPASCGLQHTQCTQFSFTTNRLPDSIRVFGVESNGNAFGGCMPNWDMLIHFRILPVIWGHFEAESSGNGNRLSWSTLTQTNNDRFEVQRSSEGDNFYTLTEIAGAGNSNASLSYGYLDQNPATGSNYYRIKQVDLDGNFSYSEVVTVNYAPASDLQYLTVAPNPSNGVIRIQYKSAENAPLSVQIFDISGKQHFEGEYKTERGKNYLSLDLQAFPAGIYFLRVSEGGRWIDRKIVLL